MVKVFYKREDVPDLRPYAQQLLIIRSAPSVCDDPRNRGAVTGATSQKPGFRPCGLQDAPCWRLRASCCNLMSCFSAVHACHWWHAGGKENAGGARPLALCPECAGLQVRQLLVGAPSTLS